MDRVTPVLVGTLAYGIVFLLCAVIVTPPKHLTSKEQKNYFGFHVSFIHSVVASVLALWIICSEGGLHYERAFNQTHIWVLGLTLGYFIYDILYAEFFGLHDNLMRFHHVFVLLGGGMMYFSETGGVLAMFVLLLTESSNPAMQSRLILKARKQDEGPFFQVVQLLFVFQFIFNRGVLASPMVYNVWFYNLDLMIKVSASMLYGASMIWIFIILGIVSKKTEGTWVIGFALTQLKKVHKEHTFIVNGLILGSALLLPNVLKFLGAQTVHLSVFGALIF